MGRLHYSLLTLRAVAAIAALAASTAVTAQENKPKKSSPKYEEHYELVPAEGDPSMPAPAGGANLDPEGDTPRPAPRPATPAASHKGPFSAPAPRAPEPEPAETRVQAPERKAGPPPEEQASRPAKRLEPQIEPVREPASRKRSQPYSEEAAASGGSTSTVDFFYAALDDGGSWQDTPRYGKVFVPKVGEDWRPYSLGRWAYADDYGWTWISDEPFGWATYHYGRWAFDADMGWAWIPGTEWAPSWVVWRQGEDAIGWAPLPPSARVLSNSVSVDAVAIEGDRFTRAWVFIDPRYFGQPGMRRYVRPVRWNEDLIARTAARVGYARDGDRLSNRGISPDDIERLAGRPVQRFTISLNDDPRFSRPDTSRAGAIKLYQPGAKRMEELARKGSQKRERDDLANGADKGPSAPREDVREATGSRDDANGSGKPRKASATKTVTKFAPQPVLQRVETESGVTESWVAPEPAATEPAKTVENKPAEGKSADGKPGVAKSEAKFAPATSQRTETESAVTESWASPAPATKPAAADTADEKRSPSGKAKSSTAAETPSGSKKAVQAETIERGHGARYESYSVPSPEITGEAPAGASSAAAAGAATGSVAKPKRRWDGSGTSGAPGMIPGAVQ